MIVTRGIGRGGKGAIAAFGYGRSAAVVVVSGPGCLHLYVLKMNTVDIYVLPSSCD